MNALGRIVYHINVPEEHLTTLMGGKPDDGTDEYFQEALKRLERAVSDDPMHYVIEHSHSEPDVEVDG
jgi:hypothetical protein